jgi:nucleoid DNA-binding protein
MAVLGTGLAVVPGTALAMNKAELIEAMASESGLSKADSKRALEGFTSATTKALKKGDRLSMVGFGSFSISKRAARTGRSPQDRSFVEFDRCPSFAAALDLIPGRGDEQRNQSCPGVRKGDVVLDAALLAQETASNGERGLSEETAAAALEAFLSTTTKALKKGDRLSMVGFGSFSISKRSARTGRNPQTGKEIQIAAKNVVKFKAGAELSKAVN